MGTTWSSFAGSGFELSGCDRGGRSRFVAAARVQIGRPGTNLSRSSVIGNGVALRSSRRWIPVGA
ncbi:hypothetical protein GCM10012279_45310 [Micromonospora yangpuensis]|nr:hypothetical protein GCM10012279_45310 [Micromonospora yangpuensis]